MFITKFFHLQFEGDFLKHFNIYTFVYFLLTGVTAGITPFNFPAMIPMWMFPMALVTGNTMVVKPSERDPGATMIMMDLLNQVLYTSAISFNTIDTYF